jgi:ribosome biogenesis GTPase / thiamine phosphate phosphatase
VRYSLKELGWNGFFEQILSDSKTAGWTLARVTAEHKGYLQAQTEEGNLLASVSGKLRHRIAGTGDWPAVGDWVELRCEASKLRGRIERVFPRRSKLVRKVAGRQVQEQVLAANLDLVFIVSALNQDLNLRRIERYLAMAWDSGAQPVLLLNKADLCVTAEEVVQQVQGVAPAVKALLLSAETGAGVEELLQMIGVGTTTAFVGSSGVGKSTIINRLLGDELVRTQPVRQSDDRGRHTTTSRQMHFLPAGGIVIDTPGMRELGLWENSAGVERAFDDIQALAQECRFRDCTHGAEPGCAVHDAIRHGDLSEERLENLQKLEAERRFLERKVDLVAATREKDRWKKIHKAMRQRKPVW